jgi:hypothetical protein
MPQPTDSFLLLADLASAQLRSSQMATRMGCDGVATKYWYDVIPLTNGQGAVCVQASGIYGTKPGATALSQLTPAEIAALASFLSVQVLLPPLPALVQQP